MRITEHPILKFSDKKQVKFYFNDKLLYGYEGEPIIVALRANGVIKLKDSSKDHKPQGAYCMQGRCASCTMTVDGNPNTMTCVTALREGMTVYYQGTSLDTEVFKKIPSKGPNFNSTEKQMHPDCDVAIIGAGPAGLEATLMCAEAGVKNIILLDDKTYIGGQLKLQTHTFFGTKELGAGKRGFVIAEELEAELKKFSSVQIKLNATVLGMYPANILAFKDASQLNFLKAKKIIVATGASEKSLSFEGNYLPGVIGAGAAQTFMNLYGVKPGNKVLIVGGGNIGVILAYQLAQAGIEVASVIEAGPEFRAYKVHTDKIKALGINTLVKHTIIKAVKDETNDAVAGAVISEVDSNFKILPKTEKYIDCDTICLAVGLNPLNELLWQAGCEFKFLPEIGEVPYFDEYRTTSNKDIFLAGDCAVIGEASIARLEGRIAGLKASLDLGFPHIEFRKKIDDAFYLLDNIQTGTFGEKLGTAKKKLTGSGFSNNFKAKAFEQNINECSFKGNETLAVIDCAQDIPCNPCEKNCPKGAITIGPEINQMPSIDNSICTGCGICINACPGRAIRLVQYNYNSTSSRLVLPYEFLPEPSINSDLELMDSDGVTVCIGKVLKTKFFNSKNCAQVEILVDKKFAFKAKAIRFQVHSEFLKNIKNSFKDSSYVCRCEEVSYEKVLELIDAGYTTINQLRRVARIGMGPCRGLQCRSVLEALLKQYLKISGEQILAVKNSRRTIFRAPIKRITLGEAARLNFSDDELKKIRNIEEERTVPLEIHDNFRSPYIEEKTSFRKKIVIVGAGIAGVCTAYELAKLGFDDILVLEKDFISSGASSAALGGIRTGFSSFNKIKRSQYGLEFYKNFSSTFKKDIGWYQGGYVYLAYDEKIYESFKACLNLWKELNVETVFSQNFDEISKWMPGLYKDNLVGAVLFPQAGGANPFLSTFYIAEEAKKLGVEFLCNEELVDVYLNNDKVEAVLTRTGKKIYCEHLINCSGSYAVRVSKMVKINLSGLVKIDRHESIITEKMPLWLDPLVVNYHPSLSGYWQQKRTGSYKEGELVACFTPNIPLYGYNTSSDVYCMSRMAQSILMCQPNLENVGIVRSYAHHYVGRESGTPIVGFTPIKGFWQNIAQKGHGFMCAPGDSHALALSIKEGKTHSWITECSINENQTIETMG